MIPTDASSQLAFGLSTLLVAVVLYVWTALALSAVFRKSGEPAYAAWVPIFNGVVLLRLGGLPGLSYLLVFLPVVGVPIVWVLIVTACYRINVSFGHGAGMTVLAALLLPVWASVLGFGPSRWLGTEPEVAAGPLRTPPADADPREASPGRTTSLTSDPAPLDVSPFAPEPSRVPAFVPARAAVPAADLPVADAPAAGRPVAHEPFTVLPVTVVPVPDLPVVAVPVAEPALAESPGVRETPEAARQPAAASAPVHTFLDEPLDEATDAEPGAPSPVAAVGSTFDRPPVTTVAPPVAAAPPLVTAPPVNSAPSVTRMPVAGPRPASEDPWAKPREANTDEFPELSGEVSAISGAPDAGSPRSARGSVSAQFAREAAPDLDIDALDQTIITRRRRTAWTLIPPAGAAVALRGDVVLLGRKPAADPAFPGAQLVAVDDGTVSKTHAMLRLREDRWFVTDLHSTNGVLFATFMGTEVEATPGVEIEAGERFFLGDAEVKLQRSDG